MDIFLELLKPILPTILLLLGGRWVLSLYEISKKRREQEIELSSKIREQQYQAVKELYDVFSKLMSLYRRINASPKYPGDEAELFIYFNEAVQIESQADGLILKISCEFMPYENEELEVLLGHMRQSVQLWREKITSKEKLPFNNSHQKDYTQFKETFSAVATYMVYKIHTGFDAPAMQINEARNVIMNVFSNKYEHLEYQSIQSKEDWVNQLKQVKK